MTQNQDTQFVKKHNLVTPRCMIVSPYDKFHQGGYNTEVSKKFQSLQGFLDNHKDPELLVLGNSFWSICCKPNHTLALEEYSSGLTRLLPVIFPIL